VDGLLCAFFPAPPVRRTLGRRRTCDAPRPTPDHCSHGRIHPRAPAPLPIPKYAPCLHGFRLYIPVTPFPSTWPPRCAHLQRPRFFVLRGEDLEHRGAAAGGSHARRRGEGGDCLAEAEPRGAGDRTEGEAGHGVREQRHRACPECRVTAF
jgi:hypothetical protein